MVPEHPPSHSSYTALSIAVTTTAATVAVAAASAYFYMQNMQTSKIGDAVNGFPSPPDAHWLFGHLIQLNGGDEGFTKGYEDVYVRYTDKSTGRGSFWFFTAPAVSLLQARDVKMVLQASSYRKDMSAIAVHTKNFLGPKALVALMGKEWRLFRSAIHKSFTPAAIRQSQHIIYQVGDLLADTLLESDSIVSNPADTSPKATKILPIMKMATIDVFGLAVLDMDFQCCAKLELSPVANAFDLLTAEYTRRLRTPWDPFSFLYNVPTRANRMYQKQQSIIRGFIAGQIQKAKEAIVAEEKAGATVALSSATTTSDVLTNLIKAATAEAAAKGEAEVSDDALGDVMMTLLFGGYDTTSITLTYALYLLAKHPEYEKACVQEIEFVIGKATTNINDTDIGPDRLPFCRAVIMETLRLYPPAPITSRNMEKDLELSNPKLVIPKDQLVILPIWCIQRSELNFPRPTEMLPERWVRRRKNVNNSDAPLAIPNVSEWEDRPSDEEDSTSSSEIPAGNKDAFCVFSGTGARNCVGKVLAMQESVTLLAMLLRKCKFELIDPNYEVKPFVCAVVQQPKDGLPMKISKR